MAFGTMSCLHEAPTRSEEDTLGTAIAARTTIGSTETQVRWIRTLSDLRNINVFGGNYKLANDIDASATAQTPFVPIRATKDFFRGTLDGDSKKITNLNIVGTGSYTGIFTKSYNAIFRNIRLENVTVTGGYSTGAIAGYAENFDMYNSYITGTVTGNSSGDRLGLAFGSTGRFTRIYRMLCHGSGARPRVPPGGIDRVCGLPGDARP